MSVDVHHFIGQQLQSFSSEVANIVTSQEAVLSRDELLKQLADAEKELYWELSGVAADIAGTVDPTPIFDVIAAGISIRNGDYLGAGLSILSVVPYLGDAIAKPIKAGRAGTKILKLRKVISKLKKRVEKLEESVSKITDRIDLGEDVATGIMNGRLNRKVSKQSKKKISDFKKKRKQKKEDAKDKDKVTGLLQNL